jgi:hypothetical protein
MPLGAWKNPGPVTHVAFDREGKNLFAGIDHSNSQFSTLVRWDLASSTPLNSLFPVWGAEIQTLSVSPNGEYCIIQRGYKRPDQTLLCKTSDMSVVAELDCSGDASRETFSWSNDSSMLAYPNQGPRPEFKRSWIILRSGDGKRIHKHAYDGICLAAHLNTDYLLALEEDGEVMMIPLDSEERAQTASIDTDGKIDAAVFSPDGKNILIRRSVRDSYNGAYLTSFSVELLDGILSCSEGGETSRYWENTQQVRETWPYSNWSSPFWKGVLASEQAGTWLPLTSSDRGLRAPLSVRGGNVEIIDHSPNGDALPCAPLLNAEEVRSYAEHKDLIAIGTEVAIATSFTPSHALAIRCPLAKNATMKITTVGSTTSILPMDCVGITKSAMDPCAGVRRKFVISNVTNCGKCSQTSMSKSKPNVR